MNTVAKVVGGLGLAAAATVAYAAFIERKAYTLREVEAAVLPAGSAPMRILHLSDMHLAPWQSDKIAWVRELADLEPDLVVNTGDNLGHAEGFAAVETALELFAGVPGLFVNGSNDYFAPEMKNPFAYLAGPSRVKKQPVRLNTARMTRYFADVLGWTDLNNHAALLTVGGVRIDALGVDDPHRKFDDEAAALSEFDSVRSSGDALGLALDDEVAKDAALTLGVAHAPYRRVLDTFVDAGADVIFAGHTHGGQVCVPGYGALVTNCDLPREQAKGLSTWSHNGRHAVLNVSAGLGTSIYAPVRLACRPEASLVTLTAKN